MEKNFFIKILLATLVIFIASCAGIKEAEFAYSWQVEESAKGVAQEESINVQSGHWLGVQVTALEKAVIERSKKYPSSINRDEVLTKISAFKSHINAATVPANVLVDFYTLQQEVLLSNPELDTIKDVVYRQTVNDSMPANWVGNSSMMRTGYNNEIRSFEMRDSASEKTVLKPGSNGMMADAYLGDIVPNYEADKFLYSSIAPSGQWELFESNMDGSSIRQVSKPEFEDIDNFNGVYLPDGKILFCSTATMVGVPCVWGYDHVANLYVMDPDGSNMRQLTYEQDADWYPYVMNSGKVMYLRWEYTDNSHYFTRVLMSMNPDGTEQKALYGSNSYWPNSMFYAKQLPNQNTKFVAIVTGHHGVARAGELYLFDTAKGEIEGEGAVLRMGAANMEPRITVRDNLVDGIWPQYLHPYPLSEDTFLVASKTDANSKWGIYLMDIYGTRMLVKESADFHLLEPVPVLKREKPPVIPSRVDDTKENAIVYIQDLYTGEGLKDVPRGMVKQLRISTYAYTLRNLGNHDLLGVESAWDGKIMLGTVDVEEDGSCIFEMPANLPITIQALDKNGSAIQLMRSWTTAMPGEFVSCIGCHERSHDVPKYSRTIASGKEPQQLDWTFEQPTGIGYIEEIQPIWDQHCISCHNGKPGIPNLKDTKPVGQHKFSRSYHDLHPYVRRPGPESDFAVLAPMEYHANTSELMQMLDDGHYGVELDPLSYRKLVRWIDLNVPYYPNYRQYFAAVGRGEEYDAVEQKAFKIRDRYNAYVVDHSVDPATVDRLETAESVSRFVNDSEDYDVEELIERLKMYENKEDVAINVKDIDGNLVLSNGTAIMQANKIPAGSTTFKKTGRTVTLEKDIYVATTEVTNQFYNLYNPEHDSRYFDQQWKDHVGPGYPANRPTQPVVKISWHEAQLFCEWLSEKIGKKVRLLTEDEWMYAAAAGTTSEFYFGDTPNNYGFHANLADYTLVYMAVFGIDPQPASWIRSIYTDFLPRDKMAKDGRMVSTGVGTYRPNPFGLTEMHGNVQEFVGSPVNGRVLAKGGSFMDRQFRSGVSNRQLFYPWQKVYNTGFRFCIEE